MTVKELIEILQKKDGNIEVASTLNHLILLKLKNDGDGDVYQIIESIYLR